MLVLVVSIRRGGRLGMRADRQTDTNGVAPPVRLASRSLVWGGAVAVRCGAAAAGCCRVKGAAAAVLQCAVYGRSLVRSQVGWMDCSRFRNRNKAQHSTGGIRLRQPAALSNNNGMDRCP